MSRWLCEPKLFERGHIKQHRIEADDAAPSTLDVMDIRARDSNRVVVRVFRQDCLKCVAELAK
jgi:hypothetical protein